MENMFNISYIMLKEKEAWLEGGATWAGGSQKGGGIRRVEAVATSNSISALNHEVMIEPKLGNDDQGEGGLMRRGSDMGGRFAEGGGESVEGRRVATSRALKQGVMKEPKLRNT